MFQLNDNCDIIGEPERLQVSGANDFKHSTVFIDGHSTEQNRLAKARLILRLGKEAGTISFRASGSNLDHQVKVAKGAADACITDSVGGPFDLSGNLIITEAGGMFTDIDGNPVRKNTQLAIGSNGKIHSRLLEIVNKSYKKYRGYK